MRLHITLNITEIDTQKIKGEELDAEIESQIEDIQLDGWEVTGVTIGRAKQGNFKVEEIQALFACLAREVEDHAKPSRINPALTKGQLIAEWKKDIKKLIA